MERETLEIQERLINSYKEITGGWLRRELVEVFSLYRSIVFFLRYGTKGREMKCFEEENEPQEKERLTKVFQAYT